MGGSADRVVPAAILPGQCGLLGPVKIPDTLPHPCLIVQTKGGGDMCGPVVGRVLAAIFNGGVGGLLKDPR